MNGKASMELRIGSSSENESLARICVAAFAARLDPTLEEIADIKTAVSEAVTNCILHGYEEGEGDIYIRCKIEEKRLYVEVEDKGVGIADIRQAMEPMGFAFMEAFMDELSVISSPGAGTKVSMEKEIGKAGSYGYSGTD